VKSVGEPVGYDSFNSVSDLRIYTEMEPLIVALET